MNWTILAKKIGALGLPALGTALAGPGGAAVGAKIAAVLGVEEAPDSVARAIVNYPEAELALRKLEAEMAEAERQHAERVIAAEAATVKATRAATVGHWLTPILTLVLISMVVGLGAALFLIEPPQANRDLVNVLLGNVMGWAGAGVVYWLGSSRGSAEKQSILERRP
jgi:hypothetical protein